MAIVFTLIALYYGMNGELYFRCLAVNITFTMTILHFHSLLQCEYRNKFGCNNPFVIHKTRMLFCRTISKIIQFGATKFWSPVIWNKPLNLIAIAYWFWAEQTLRKDFWNDAVGNIFQREITTFIKWQKEPVAIIS